MKKAVSNLAKLFAGAAVVALAGCGGSSEVGGAPETGSGAFQVKLHSEPTLALKAGDVVQFPATAVSFPEPMASMSWTAYSTNGGPTLELSNANCATASKKSQAAATEGKVTEEWTCAAGIKAPANVTAEAKYVLSVTATDKAGNSSTSKTDVTVAPGAGVSSNPSASANIPSAATAGSTVTATCDASNGYTQKPGKYTIQWVATPALPFATTDEATATFVAPKVTAPTEFTLTCRVTDDNQKTATSSGKLTISPPASPTIVPSVPAGRSVAPNETLSLDGSGTTWVDSYGAPLAKPIFYSWTQTKGPVVEMFNTNTPKATATMPSSVSARTVFAFTLKTSDQPFTNGVTAGQVTTSADVVYHMDVNPQLELTTSFKESVDSGGYVTIPVVAKATPTTTLPLYYSWTQVSGPVVAMGGTTTSTLNFGAPVNSSPTNPIILVFRASVGYEPISASSPAAAVLDVVVVVDPPKAN